MSGEMANRESKKTTLASLERLRKDTSARQVPFDGVTAGSGLSRWVKILAKRSTRIKHRAARPLGTPGSSPAGLGQPRLREYLHS